MQMPLLVVNHHHAEKSAKKQVKLMSGFSRFKLVSSTFFTNLRLNCSQMLSPNDSLIFILYTSVHLHYYVIHFMQLYACMHFTCHSSHVFIFFVLLLAFTYCTLLFLYCTLNFLCVVNKVIQWLVFEVFELQVTNVFWHCKHTCVVFLVVKLYNALFNASGNRVYVHVALRGISRSTRRMLRGGGHRAPEGSLCLF